MCMYHITLSLLTYGSAQDFLFMLTKKTITQQGPTQCVYNHKAEPSLHSHRQLIAPLIAADRAAQADPACWQAVALLKSCTAA